MPLFVPQLCRPYRLYRFVVSRKTLILREKSGGHARNRTRVRGFGVRSVTTPPRGLGIEAGEVLARDQQHAAGARRRVLDRAHHSRLGQHVVLDEKEVWHEADDFAAGVPGLGLWRVWNGGLANYGTSTASWRVDIRVDMGGPPSQ